MKPFPTIPDTQTAYAWAYEHVLFPGWQKLVHGREVAPHLHHLEASQWASEEDRAREQVKELRTLLKQAARTRYYGELFAKIGFDPRDVTSIEHLHELPLLTRETVKERYYDLLDPERGATIHKGTSGTTGVPVRFEYSNDSEAWRTALRLHRYGWAGYHPGLPTLHYWASQFEVPHGLRAVKIRVDRALRREVYVDCVRQDEEYLRHVVDVIRQLRPRVIVGYTKATALLARYVSDRGLRDWDREIPVICAAEALDASDHAAIARAFGPTFETYGSRETMLIAAECEMHDGLHLSEENLVVEVVEDGGKPAPVGQSGSVVITDLHNHAMPFVRYVNGDAATMGTGCKCGRSLRVLRHVDGRTCDTLHDPSGAPIPGMFVIGLFARPDDLVRQFQVVQGPTGEVTLRVVPGREWSDAKFATLERRFRDQVRGAPVMVELCDAIRPGPSGKMRPIVVERS
jgi:phenylacetate-CoA ligase